MNVPKGCRMNYVHRLEAVLLYVIWDCYFAASIVRTGFIFTLSRALLQVTGTLVRKMMENIQDGQKMKGHPICLIKGNPCVRQLRAELLCHAAHFSSLRTRRIPRAGTRR